MHKLRLDPEMLRVESFTADADGIASRGTVDAHSYLSNDIGACSEEASAQCQDTDVHLYTCGNSCVNHCFLTGNDPTCIN